MSTQGLYDRIYDLVRAVPPGYVTTYGELARRIGTSARVVGFAMAVIDEDEAHETLEALRGLGEAQETLEQMAEGARAFEEVRS